MLKEPLLHFAVIGAVVFGGYSWLNGKTVEAKAVEPVRVAEGDVRWLKQTWSSQWLREPSADELKGLVDDLLKEKLMAREAEAMGLDQDDTIIRRRLAQKLKFLVEDTAQLAEPPEEELRRFYAANSTRFETPGKLSFKQIYFNPEKRADAPTDAAATLAEIKANGGDMPTRAIGCCSATASTTLTSWRCQACSVRILRMKCLRWMPANGEARSNPGTAFTWCWSLSAPRLSRSRSRP